MIQLPFTYSGKIYEASLKVQEIGEITWYRISFSDEEVIKAIGHELRFVKRNDYLSCITEGTSSNSFLINHFHDQILLHLLKDKQASGKES
ncbi:MAG: hypothetical protein JWN76_365 [Chitinophagaceae bacterium]|nr:hypothetical protein [Chitinophagaceae bacterium]